jgi:hypothetical protein
MHGFATTGVNVRPSKPRFESRLPRGISVAAHYGNWAPPAPHEGRRRASARLAARQGERALALALDDVRAELYAAQDSVSALKASGVGRSDPAFKAAAQRSRAARAAWLKLNGGLERRELELAQASDANKIKAV